MTLFSKAFLSDTVRRAVYTAAQSGVAVLGVSASFTGLDWKADGLLVLYATVMSLLTSVARADNSGAQPTTQVQPGVSPEALAGAFRGALPEPKPVEQPAPNFQAPPAV